jgi:hypothetical protein
MSKIKLETIWQHEQVLPYILNELKQKIDNITTVQKIYLFGSRAKTPVEDWHTIEGKDWDIIVQAKFKLTNTHIWTTDKNYHIDLYVVSEEQTDKILLNTGKTLELFPCNELECLMNKNDENGYITKSTKNS